MAWIKLTIDVLSMGLYSVITARLLKKAKEINEPMTVETSTNTDHEINKNKEKTDK